MLICDLRHRCGNMRGNFPNPRKCWIQAALIKITPCDKIGQGLRRAHKHVICDDPRTTCNRTKADAGKDIRIVSLPRDKGFAIKFDGRKGTSASEQGAAVSVLIGLRGGAFGF